MLQFITGLTKPGEVGDFFVLVSMKSPNISVKKQSFSRPVSLFKSVFISPIIILFLQYSHKRSAHVPEM
jgi:hypothetical protein